MRRILFILPAFCLLALPAGAQEIFRSVGTVQGNFPLDSIATTPTACYSERRLRSAYATDKAINIVRASDSATLDIGFLAGMPNKAAETTFCNATTCKLVTVYDQCGSNNLTQATDGNRFTRQTAPNTFGSWNVSQATAATQTHAGGSNITPATGLVTMATVANRSVGTGICGFVRENGNNNKLQARSAATGWALAGGTSGFLNAANADAAWTAGIGVIAGASSFFNTNGTEVNTGTSPTGNTTAGAPAIIGVASTTCNQVEQIIWDNATIGLSDRAYYVTQARIAWGF